MHFASNSSQASVSKHGAPGNSVLRGSGISNQGLRVQITAEQPRGQDGPIQGPFVILDAGKNRHSQALASLLNKTTDSQEVLNLIRREHPACVNVVNANILVVEEKHAPAPTDPEQRVAARPTGAAPEDVGTISNPDF